MGSEMCIRDRNTRLIGSGRYVSCLSASASSASHRSTPYASMSAKSWPSRPVRPLPPQGQALVRTALGVSMRQNIRTVDLVVQGVEAIAGFCLRFRVSRYLQASEHSSELLGCPISRSLTTSCICLELRPLPSTGITRSQRYCEPLRHPSAPSLSLAGIRLIIPDHALGLPVLRTLSLCTCRRHYPGAADRRTRRSNLPIHINLPRNHYRVGLHIVLFEDCSAFTHVAACTLARSPNS